MFAHTNNFQKTNLTASEFLDVAEQPLQKHGAPYDLLHYNICW